MLPNVTEVEWLQAADVRSMDARWIAKHDSRKWRHFAAACCRRVLVLVPDPLLESLIDATEEFADGFRTWKEMTAFRRRFREEYQLPPKKDTQPRKVAFDLSRAV